MRKRLFWCLLSLTLCTTRVALAQSEVFEKSRVAVFDPTSIGKSIDEGTVVAVREMISSALVNSGKFNIVERSLLDKIMSEQKFSNSGAVDASQASELGKLLGANKVVISVLSVAGPRYMLSVKMIDVQSANIESQKVKTVKPEEIFDAVESLTLALVSETSIPASTAKPDNNFTEVLSTKPQEKEVVVEKNNKEVVADSSSDGREVELVFAGFEKGKNLTAEIFCDGKLVGNGTLNQGFSIKFTDKHPGRHTITITWSGTVGPQFFKINTAKKRYYVFEYGRRGTLVGYPLKLKNN